MFWELKMFVTPGKDLDRKTWEAVYEEIPTELTETEKRDWLTGLSNVALGSDAFFPFRDNIDRARLVSTIQYLEIVSWSQHFKSTKKYEHANNLKELTCL